MAVTASIPVYLSIGGGSSVEIGTIELAADSHGQITLTTFDIAAALRDAADAIEEATREAEQPAEGSGEEADGATP
ncbi:hypothetical protein [Streptomyces sp. SudanB91_2054]|uniref:hypothetical protein n=1 Tax=Streptomyces sp. SudanB91_2054 TaxID=3035278 RepID=UPI0036DB52FF